MRLYVLFKPLCFDEVHNNTFTRSYVLLIKGDILRSLYNENMCGVRQLFRGLNILSHVGRLKNQQLSSQCAIALNRLGIIRGFNIFKVFSLEPITSQELKGFQQVCFRLRLPKHFWNCCGFESETLPRLYVCCSLKRENKKNANSRKLLVQR